MCYLSCVAGKNAAKKKQRNVVFFLLSVYILFHGDKSNVAVVLACSSKLWKCNLNKILVDIKKKNYIMRSPFL